MVQPVGQLISSQGKKIRIQRTQTPPPKLWHSDQCKICLYNMNLIASSSLNGSSFAVKTTTTKIAKTDRRAQHDHFSVPLRKGKNKNQ